MWFAAAPLPAAGPSPRCLRQERRCRRRQLRSRAVLSTSSYEPHGKKRVVIAGAGWAGLAAAHHLIKQGYDVTLLDAGDAPTEEVGPRGFWYPYQNIFSIVDELGIEPFTDWTKASYYSPKGVVVNLPVFQDQPRLPAPLGLVFYPQLPLLPLLDRLTALGLIAAIVDFDNTDTAWRKYDALTARELLRSYGCSRELYEGCFEPAIQVSLLSPTEQCSAAATLGLLYYYAFSHQQHLDFLLCRGEIREKILNPWLHSLQQKGLKFCAYRTPNDFVINEEIGSVSRVICGEESYEADAFILALGVSALQSTVVTSPLLQSREEFLNTLNLSSVDVVSVRLWFDKKVVIPKSANVSFGFDNSTACAFFDLSTTYDEYSEFATTIIDADFYSASHLLPLEDEKIVENLVLLLCKCVKQFKEATVMKKNVLRFPKSASHFFPGSYKYMMRGSTSFPNLFMAGDWIVNRHGSFAKEKACVTGLEAANRVIDYLGEGEFAKIIAVEEDEPHIEQLRNLNRRAIKWQGPYDGVSGFLLPADGDVHLCFVTCKKSSMALMMQIL